jgi:hypothetical protein
LQNYADYYEFGLAKGIGYSYYAERPGWPMPYLWIGVRQAKIYDSVGVALYYDPTIKPVISYDAQSLTDSAYFNPSLQVRHPYSTFFKILSLILSICIDSMGFMLVWPKIQLCL